MVAVRVVIKISVVLCRGHGISLLHYLTLQKHENYSVIKKMYLTF